MSQLPFTPLIDSLPASVPFVGPEAQERQLGKAFTARIGANESVFGPSEEAIAAMQSAAAEAWMYGDPEMHDLRRAIADQHAVGPEHIMIGEGIDGLFGYTVRLFVENGTPVVTSKGAYPTFVYHVKGFGGALTAVDYRDDKEDPEALLEAAKRVGARLLFLANPDNPMGSWHNAAAVEDLIAHLPERTILLLDEAYADFAPAEAIPALDVSHPQVLRFRTFSKAHGLAGLRVGYVIGAAETIDAYNKIRNHFGIGRVAQAGALAAIRDQAHLARVVAAVNEAKERIGAIAADNGLTALPSATNFVAIDCGRDGDYARAVLAGLVKRGVFVRMPGVPPLDRCIRVTVGREADCDAFAAALPEALKEAAG